jgi:hypothetical protein
MRLGTRKPAVCVSILNIAINLLQQGFQIPDFFQHSGNKLQSPCEANNVQQVYSAAAMECT